MSDPLPPIIHPARFVPLTALATGEPGMPAEPIGADHPLPVKSRSFDGARPLTVGESVAPGAAFLVDCTAGGRATLVLADGSDLPLSLSPGLTMLPLAVQSVRSAGLSADAEYWVLD